MSAPPRMKGFDVEPKKAWLVTCKTCKQHKLVYGDMADDDGLQWASDHWRDNHRPTPVSP